ncbi:MAG TPA: glycosyltransferase family 4 protein [Chloroflexota bacterium]|jgi:glycosyltransferase involved in cell wall biosynthesis
MMADPLVVLLVTLGDPDQLTGGYLYHRRLADLAPQQGARLGFVSVPEAPFPMPALAAGRVAAAIRAERPAAVIVDSIAAAYLAPALRRLADVPLVGSLHQTPGGIDHGPLRTWLQARLDLLVYRHCALLLVASELLADQLVAWDVPRAQLRVVPPGRDVVPEVPARSAPADGLFAAVRAASAPPPEPARDLRQGRAAAFLCVGNWMTRKGIVPLLDAFARLPADAGTLHLVGKTDVEPAYAAQVRARLAAPALRERVVVHGPVALEEVAALYRAADVFVLPSTQEPFGTVYGEAMALGLPVVGVRAGNLPHLATDGVEGRIVPVGDTAALADAMLALARDESGRRRMGAAARARAQTRPTWEGTAARFFGAVRAVMAHRAPAPT